MSRPARLAPHTMMVTSAAETVLATTLFEMLDMLPPLDELRDDSRDATRNGTNGSDDSDELRLRHIRPAPHRLTLLQLQEARLNTIKTTENPIDFCVTHTPNHNRRHGPDTHPSTPSGEVLTAAFWNQQVRDNSVELAPFFAAWTAYTPSAIGGGLNVGNGTFDAAYLKVGLLVVVRMRFTLGSTSSIGNGPAFTLPVTSATRVHALQSAFYDLSATTYYPAFIDPSATDRMTFLAINAGSTNAVASTCNASTPFTWATGDQFYTTIIYTSST